MKIIYLLTVLFVCHGQYAIKDKSTTTLISEETDKIEF